MPSNLEYQETVSSFQHVILLPMLDQVVNLRLIYSYLKSFAGRIYNLNGNWNAWIFIVMHYIILINNKNHQIFVNPNCMNVAIHTIGHVPCKAQLPTKATVSPVNMFGTQKTFHVVRDWMAPKILESTLIFAHMNDIYTYICWPRRLKNILMVMLCMLSKPFKKCYFAAWPLNHVKEAQAPSILAPMLLPPLHSWKILFLARAAASSSSIHSWVRPIFTCKCADVPMLPLQNL